MVFVAGRSFCQKKPGFSPELPVLFYYKQAMPALHHTTLIVYDKRINISFSASFTSLPVIAADYYSNHLGFFCKKEIQFEKITKIPFKFRLGSVQQCDRLEGKSGAITQ